MLWWTGRGHELYFKISWYRDVSFFFKCNASLQVGQWFGVSGGEENMENWRKVNTIRANGGQQPSAMQAAYGMLKSFQLIIISAYSCVP